MIISVTRRVYRRLSRPDGPNRPVGAQRRRQLAALVECYGVHDARPVTVEPGPTHSGNRLDGRRVIGEVLL